MDRKILAPKALPGESPSSIMLRLAHANTEKPLNLIRKSITTATLARDLRLLVAGKPADYLQKMNFDLSDWNLPQHTVTVSSEKRHKFWLNFGEPTLCPLCADEGQLPITHDYAFIRHCTRHEVKLVESCPHCGERLSLNRYGLNRCHCFELITSAKPSSKKELAATRELEKWIFENEEKKLAVFCSLRSPLQDRLGITDDLELPVQSYLNGDVEPLAKLIAPIAAAAKPITPRGVVAALYMIKPLTERYRLPELAEAVERLCPKAMPSSLPKGFYLTHSELLFAWGCKPDTLTDLLSRSFEPPGHPSLTKVNKVERNDLMRAFHLFREPNKEGGVPIGFISESEKVPMSEIVERLLNGEMKSVGARSWRLNDILIDAPKPLSAPPDGYITQAEVSSIIRFHMEYIGGFRRAGFLKAEKQNNKNNRFIYKRSDVEEFARLYVTASDIRRLTGASATTVSQKLEHAGIMPISGPGIDSGKVFLFRRSDIDKVDLEKVFSVTENYAKSGRKPPGHRKLDMSKWLPTKDAASEIGISIQLLSAFAERGLIQQTNLDVESMRRGYYYRRSDVASLKKFINELMTVDDASAACGLSRRRFLSRLQWLLDAEPYVIDGESLVPPEDVERVKKHATQYWDAVKVADYLGVEKSTVFNWKKAGALKALERNQPGYLQSPVLFEASTIQTFNRPENTNSSRRANQPNRGKDTA